MTDMLRIGFPLRLLAVGLVATLAWNPVEGLAQAPEVNFSQDIQPLLARRCFACHGPDVGESGLRLHQSESALATLDSGTVAIVPGDPDASELMTRVRSNEEGVRMPPEGKPLTVREQELLAGWIAQGAEWKQHWAFEPLSAPPIPVGGDGQPAANPVDAFIDAKLAQRDLVRAPQAESLTLLRRLYFDLIGLPPTPAQVADFQQRAANGFDAAWETEVDSLLASERYGERWARHWLDVVRYAETNSFERDGPKPNAWRYRDYVIRAFNEDKPYDQFLREQLAGDELPEVTRDSLIATGFYRLGIWDDEPADRAQALYDGFDDILTTVGQGLLGLTINCSRCHDHKIDPIPTADYYSALAFFRNLTPNGYGPNVDRPLVVTEQDRESYRANEAKIREDADRLQMRLTQVESELRNQLAERARSDASTLDLDDLEYRFYRDTFDRLPDFDTLKPETVARLDPPRIDIGVATRPEYFGFVFTGKLIVPADGEYTFRLDSDDGSRLAIDGKMILEYDGIHGVGKPVRAKVALTQGRHDLRVDYFQGAHDKGLHLEWSGPNFKRRKLTAGDTVPTADLNQLLQSPSAEMLDASLVSEYRKLRRELDQNRGRKPWDEYGMCVSEAGTQSPDTHVLMRGSPQGQGEKVEPAFLSVLGGEKPSIEFNAKANTTGRRLAFANWVTRPDHRLTSRVFVNRVWQHHFGRGIVRSSNNFGLLGDPPTHPELLDFLATQFVSQGWRLKPLHRLLVTSATYRQSSLISEEASTKDPNNDAFSRFDMRRLSAEELRDSILAANGRLNLAMYGPSIYPELSNEVLASQSVPGKGWEKTSYEEQARRSIYIHIKRSLLVPMLASFDFPEPDTSCEARFVTTQPGQALAMLNGDFLNQQAEEFSQRLRAEAGDDVRLQVAAAFRFALSREPEEREIARGLHLIEDLKNKHQLNDEQALSYFALFVFNVNEFVYLD